MRSITGTRGMTAVAAAVAASAIVALISRAGRAEEATGSEAATGAVMVGAGHIASCTGPETRRPRSSLTASRAPRSRPATTPAGPGTAAEFEDCYGPSWGRHKARTKPGVGNHEYKTAGASGYYDYFGSAAGSPSEGYYSYDRGSWHVVVLNSMREKVGGCGVTSPVDGWLEDDLAANPGRCTLAYFHHSLFSSGVHGNQAKVRPVWRALYAAHADVVVNGHDHHHERFVPQRPDGARDGERGVREFVVGTGGGERRPFGTIKPNSQARNSTFGVLKLTLKAGSYDWEFVPVAGKAFADSGTTGCH